MAVRAAEGRLHGGLGVAARLAGAAACNKIDGANWDQNEDQMILLAGTKFGVSAAKR